MITFELSRKTARAVGADAQLVVATEGKEVAAANTGSRLPAALRRALRQESFTGREGESCLWHPPGGGPRLLVVGAGKREEFDLDTVRRVFAAAARRLEKSSQHFAAELPAFGRTGPASSDRVQAAVEGVQLGSHRWNAYLTRASTAVAGRPRPLSRVTLLADPSADHAAAMRRGVLVSRATILARELVSEAPSVLTPRAMERHARRVARASGLSIRVYDERGAARLGMGCFLGVARGSDEPPRVIHLTYRPRRRDGRRPERLALVGKGITFDSGGLDIKPASGMETMKCDMAGAAAVLAAMSALRGLDCAVEVHGVLMMTENMPSGRAYKPGDILRSMSGRTVEVINTDAEGRLILVDGLEFARRLKPDRIIDLATLTGACVVALGPLCTGIMGFDRGMVDDLLAAGAATGEKMWPLPFFREYRAQLDSKVADIKHVGGRWGGAITAGQFLGEFAGRDIPWVHLDIAGPAYAEEDQALARVGGTGHPVRALLHYLTRLR